MITRVVNLRREPYDVYIGRAGNGLSGAFGNPIRVGHRCGICDTIHTRREDTIRCYVTYFDGRIATDGEFREAVHALTGKVLGCFCKPSPCHGDVIASYLNDRLRERR